MKTMKSNGLKNGNFEVSSDVSINICKITSSTSRDIMIKMILNLFQAGLNRPLKCPFKTVSINVSLIFGRETLRYRIPSFNVDGD